MSEFKFIFYFASTHFFLVSFCLTECGDIGCFYLESPQQAEFAKSNNG